MQPENPCGGQWEDGRPCANRAGKDARYCGMHVRRPVTETCCYRHPDGRRCRGTPGLGAIFCYYHEPARRR